MVTDDCEQGQHTRGEPTQNGANAKDGPDEPLPRPIRPDGTNAGTGGNQADKEY